MCFSSSFTKSFCSLIFPLFYCVTRERMEFIDEDIFIIHISLSCFYGQRLNFHPSSLSLASQWYCCTKLLKCFFIGVSKEKSIFRFHHSRAFNEFIINFETLIKQQFATCTRHCTIDAFCSISRADHECRLTTNESSIDDNVSLFT